MEKKRKELESYEVEADNVEAQISIYKSRKRFVPWYEVDLPEVGEGTQALLNKVRSRAIRELEVSREEILKVGKESKLKENFKKKIRNALGKEIGDIGEERLDILVGIVLHNTVGLGTIEILLADPHLEEIVVNNAKEPIWVYHRKHGWLKTNVRVETGDKIYNYASKIGRRVGREITTLNPLMDAHMITGDRVNASLFPISTEGNTITIRKFRRNPWTIIDLIGNNTISAELAAFLWECVEYELSLIISGGTASGKSTSLNALMEFIPANHRIVSIEQTKELRLPDFLHWVPMVTREPNPEGKGEVSMLDLLVNSLRMRPDRIVVGEVRRQREAEVLFEAMHTGHSIYATIHADTARQTIRRLTNPPISIPIEEIQTLPLIAVMYRHRKKGIRRFFQVAEIIEGSRGNINVLYEWDASDDEIEKENRSSRVIRALKLHTGLSRDKIRDEIKEKEKILRWMLDKEINTVNQVGKIVNAYYSNEEMVADTAREDEDPEEILE